MWREIIWEKLNDLQILLGLENISYGIPKKEQCYVKKQKGVSETLSYATASSWSNNKDKLLWPFGRYVFFLSFSYFTQPQEYTLKLKCYIKAEPRDNTITESFKEKKIKEKQEKSWDIAVKYQVKGNFKRN